MASVPFPYELQQETASPVYQKGFFGAFYNRNIKSQMYGHNAGKPMSSKYFYLLVKLCNYFSKDPNSLALKNTCET